MQSYGQVPCPVLLAAYVSKTRRPAKGGCVIGPKRHELRAAKLLTPLGELEYAPARSGEASNSRLRGHVPPPGSTWERMHEIDAEESAGSGGVGRGWLWNGA